MEEDRAATNLGPEVDIESSEAQSSPKLPRKRFIGRRAAAERAAAKAQENGDQDAAEGTNAVAGIVDVSDFERLDLTSLSSKADTTSSHAQPDPLRNSQQRRHQCRHCTSPTKLQLRNPQDHPPYTHVRRHQCRAPISRRTSPLRTHNLRYPHSILSRHRHVDHGRCHVRCLLY